MCPPDHLVPGQLINPGPWLCHCIQRKLGAAERAGTSGKCLLPRLFSLERGSKEKSLGRRHLPEVMCGDVKDCLVVYKKWGAKVSFFGSDPHLPTSHTCTFEVLLQPMEKVSHTSHLAQIKCNKVCYVYRQCWNTNRHIIERLVYCQCPELYKVLFVLLAVCTPNNEKSCFLHFKSWPFYVKVDKYWWYMCYNPLGFSKKDLKYALEWRCYQYHTSLTDSQI